jgi:hypothetical protein
MIHSELSIQALDGIKMFVQEWKPEGEIKAVIILVDWLDKYNPLAFR